MVTVFISYLTANKNHKASFSIQINLGLRLDKRGQFGWPGLKHGSEKVTVKASLFHGNTT